ncbi:MAG: DEAD/DEAH box helicase [Candidatus Micrarchaeia archaeon]|jgi:ATP-dependent Lhr-like helicase
MDHTLDPLIVSTAKKFGITTLTSIQTLAIPKILSGKDVLVVAPTGYGKTETAIMPVFSELARLKRAGNDWGILTIYVTPLRALNRDILLRLQKWCDELGIRLAVRHGDTPQSERQKQADNPPQFLITTPETLCSVLVHAKLSPALSATRFVIIDEYHELLEGKRGIQLGLSIARLRKKALQPIQLIGLSATIAEPEKAAKTLSANAVASVLDEKREYKLSVECIEKPKTQGQNPTNAPSKPADASDSKKASPLIARIRDLVLSHKKTLIFSNTRSNAEWLGSQLHQQPDLSDLVAVHHGSLSTTARKETEDAFKHPEGLRAIVCTSSLELGIDIGDVDLVIQIVSPRQSTRLLQRVGRSGHRTHLVPSGIVLSADALDCAESAILCIQAKERKLEARHEQRPCRDVLCHAIVGTVLDLHPQTTLGAVREILSTTPAFACVKLAQYYDLALEMSRKRILNFGMGKNLPSLEDATQEELAALPLRRMPRTLLYYYENVSTISDKKNLFVRNASTNKSMGVLDEDFAAQFLAIGATFISRGRPWKVLSVSEDEVAVEQSTDYTAAIPEWRGEEIPVSSSTASMVCFLLSEASRLSETEIGQKYHCNPVAASKIHLLATAQSKAFWVTPGEIFLENLPNQRIALHCFLGDAFNEAFAICLSNLLSQTKNRVRTRPGTYGILLDFEQPYDASKLAALIFGLSPEAFAYAVEKSVSSTPLLRARFFHVAQRFGVLPRKATPFRNPHALRRMVEKYQSSPVFAEAMDEILQDKFELPKLKALYSTLRVGSKTRVVVVSPPTPSALSKAMLDSAFSHDVSASEIEPSEDSLEQFVASTKEKTSQLVCTFCHKSFSVSLSDDWNKKISCPFCASTQVTTNDYEEILKEKERKEILDNWKAGTAAARATKSKAKKKREKARLAFASEAQPAEKSEAFTSATKKKKEADMFAVAGLIATYGMRAVIALEVFGIGPETAARLLSRMHKNEHDFFYDLLVAQKTFIRTKSFWKR